LPHDVFRSRTAERTYNAGVSIDLGGVLFALTIVLIIEWLWHARRP
jgi:hypothetical protein